MKLTTILLITALVIAAVYLARRHISYAYRAIRGGGKCAPLKDVKYADVPKWLDDGNALMIAASWCGFCKKLKPIVECAAAQTNLKVGHIDGDVHDMSIYGIQVSGFPTLVKKNSEPLVGGNYSLDDVKKWLTSS